MGQEKTDMSFYEVKEKIQKAQARDKGLRSYKEMKPNEIEFFKRMYPFSDNNILSEQFKISVDDVERIAYEHHVYKDQTYTGQAMSMSASGVKRVKADGSPATPSYLIDSLQSALTEEEHRMLLKRREEGVDPVQALQDLYIIQELRITRGVKAEIANNAMYHTMNGAVDSAHAMLKTLFEMTQESDADKNSSAFDALILQQQNRTPDK